MKLSLLVILVALVNADTIPMSDAAVSPDLVQLLEEQMVILDDAIHDEDGIGSNFQDSAVGLNEDIDAGGSSDPREDDLYLANFWLRLRTRVGFRIPGFLNLEVIPQLQLNWQKSPPLGWELYKP